MTSASTQPPACIGVFDSGVGGLSILDALRQRLPSAALMYIGDTAHAPYGDRPVAHVRERSHRIVAHLVASGARLVVVACNTATVLAIRALRERWPDVRFVGVEPGVKLAAATSRTRRVAVMSTPATSRSARMHHLIDTHARGVHVHVEACPGLAAAIERGMHEGPDLNELLRPHIASIRAADVDTVALGCTHYAFVADTLQAMLGRDTRLIDTSRAVAERTAFVSADVDVGPRRLRIAGTGTTWTMNALLARCRHLEPASVERLSI